MAASLCRYRIHVGGLLPHRISAYCSFDGWQVSPFQFEIGVADASIGIVAIVSFWRSLDFKGPVVGYLSLFSIGVAYGHFHEAISAGNTSKNNFGLLLIITLVHAVLLPVLYVMARKKKGV